MEKFLTADATGKQQLKDIGVTTSAGAADAGKAAVLNEAGFLDETLFAPGFGADAVMMTASESLSAGDFVNVWNDAGAFKVRKADATVYGKQAMGFVSSSAAASTLVKVTFEGTNTAVTGATAGNLFLSTTAGGFTATAPTSAGNVVQKIGIGVSATSINVEFSQPIELA
jgi:hypothetical protein